MATSIGVKLKMDGEAEFRQGLNNIISSTKSLDKQLSALESSFDGEKKSLEENAKQTDLLEKKKAALEKQIEETNKALEYARDNYEEGSKEISSWEGALADAQKALNETNSKLEENAQYQEESTSALGQLNAEIATQTSKLENLRDAYIDAVLQYGEGSDQANDLADKMSTLNSELQQNKDRLTAASASADGLSSSLKETGDQEENVGDVAVAMGGQFGGALSGMISAITQGGIVGAIGLVATAIIDTTEKIIDMRSEWDAGMSTIQIGTALAEEELEKFTQVAREASAAIIGADMQDAAEAVASLQTRLGLSAEDTKMATEAVEQFYKVLGVDTTSAVNNAADVMYQWGLVTGDSAKDTETLIKVLDMLTVAQENAPVSVEELTSTLSTQAVAYQSLGLDMESAISMIDSYVNHGGNMNDIATAAYNIFKNLNGEVDDLPATFNEIINTISTSTDSFATMSEEVGETGKTIEDVLGAKKAGALINTFSVAGASVDEFTESIRDTAGELDTLYQGSITTGEMIEYALGDRFDNAVYQTVQLEQGLSDLNKIAETNGLTLSKWADTGDGWSKTISSWNGSVKTLTDETSNTVYEFDRFGNLVGVTVDGVEQNIRDMKRNVNKDFEDMKKDLTDDYNAIKTELGKPIPLHISAPAIGYSTSGSGNSTSFIPKETGRYEFAAAYDQAMILTAPTIFGMSGNNLLVGGDRPGNEIVVGESHLLEMMERTVSRSLTNDIVLNIYGAEGQSVNDLADAVIDKLQREIIGSEAVYA